MPMNGDYADGWHLIDNLYSNRTVYSCTICKVVAPQQRIRVHPV